MATQTPKRDNLHGEDDTTPRFTGENNSGVYDDQTTPSGGSASYSSSNPYGGRQSSGGSSISGNSTSSPASRSEIGDQEANPRSGTDTAVDNDEKSLGPSGSSPFSSSTKGGTWNYRNNDKGRGFGLFGSKTAKGKFRLSFNPTKKRIATWAIIGLVGGGGIYSFSVLSGPFQFVHMAQNLQKHLRSNEDFGNDRTSKVLLYRFSGMGAQNGRLGVIGNAAANRFEKNLLEKGGIKPVYSEPNRRFVGYRIVDPVKAAAFIGDSQQIKLNFGRSAETVSVDNVRDRNDTRLDIVDADGPVRGDVEILSLARQNFGERRAGVKTVMTLNTTNGISSAIGFRVEKIRAGVPLHVANKAKSRIDEAAARRIDKKREADILNGVKDDGGVKANPSDFDGDGVDDSTNPADVDATEETKDYIQEFKSSGAFKTGASATVIVGVMCAAKGFGDNIDDYKQQNVLLPMIRMGTAVISLGSQVMSGNDIDLDSLGVYVKYLHDKERKTSWNQAESIRAGEGKKGGIPIPREADLRNAGDKPAFFNALDSIPALDTTCDAVNGFFNLPGIKQVSQALSTIQEEVIDAGLNLAGAPDTDELLESSLKTVSGRSVDPNAKGAAFGSMADTGAFLAANDQALSMGGVGLGSNERAQLAALEEGYEAQDQAAKSFAGRYFNPYDSSSVVSSLIDSGPSSPSHLASMTSNPVDIIGSGFSSLISGVFPKAEAATNTHDYGVKKYGFSIADQQDERFENPYVNEEFVEPRLDELNDKYGKCFGMKITENGIESADQENNVNVFKLEKGHDDYKDCRRPTSTAQYEVEENTSGFNKILSAISPFSSKTASAQAAARSESPEDLMFKRYRLYLADMVTAVSLACYGGDGDACSQVGMGVGETSAGETTEVINPNIFILGDSLTVGMRDFGGLQEKLEAKKWTPTKIEATGSRTVSLALADDIEKNKEEIKKSGTVVIALGTNTQPDFKEKARKLVKKISSDEFAPDAQIFWMNAYGGNDTYGGINSDIDDLSASMNFEVIDWAKEYKANPDKYPWGDSAEIHHTTKGYENKASFLVKEIGSPPKGGAADTHTSIDLEAIKKPSDKIGCAEGSKDVGVQDGYLAGEKIPIRVCAITSVPETGETSPIKGANGKLLVNSAMSAFYVNLVQDAKADGVDVSASEGFRLMARQQEFWDAYQNGTGNLAARPGHSNHQLGVAVDWSPSMYQWLANGNSQGLEATVSGEPWHWSPTVN